MLSSFGPPLFRLLDFDVLACITATVVAGNYTQHDVPVEEDTARDEERFGGERRDASLRAPFMSI